MVAIINNDIVRVMFDAMTTVPTLKESSALHDPIEESKLLPNLLPEHLRGIVLLAHNLNVEIASLTQENNKFLFYETTAEDLLSNREFREHLATLQQAKLDRDAVEALISASMTRLYADDNGLLMVSVHPGWKVYTHS